ncbi:MAG: protein-L-isoaspartate(D-aspartate) O-methyltransferase [Pseudomonadota bacterium]
MTSDPRVIQMIMDLRGKGVRDDQVLDAMERTPRENFVPDAFKDDAYTDAALPIAAGQTISQPYIVAFMTAAAEIDETCKVLEVGTGSGYQAAVLARLARRVYTTERQSVLFRQAQQRLTALGLSNVSCIFGDGGRGWQVQAPFDRIVVTAATLDPEPLLAQLKEDGVMVAPIGEIGAVQKLMRYRKAQDGTVTSENLLAVRFVPLIEGVRRDA